MIAIHKPVTRKVRTKAGTALVCQMTPQGIRYREPGRRTWFALEHGSAWAQALWDAAGGRPAPLKRKGARR